MSSQSVAFAVGDAAFRGQRERETGRGTRPQCGQRSALSALGLPQYAQTTRVTRQGQQKKASWETGASQ
jgi:hypothetical protein